MPPDPALVVRSPFLLEIQWEMPYSHPDYPVQSYKVQILNTTSGKLLEYSLGENVTSFNLMNEDDNQLSHYCHHLIISVSAVNALGQSMPGNVSGGFPIGMHTCNTIMISVSKAA